MKTTAIQRSRLSGKRYRLRDVVRSEWTKFASLRSSRWTLVAFAVTSVALGVLISAVTGSRGPHASAETRANWDPTNNTLAGLIPGYLVIPVLGVLMMTSEYTTGSIRPTLLAVPRRPLVLGAKIVVFTGTALVAVEVVTFVTFFAPSMATWRSSAHREARPWLRSSSLFTHEGLLTCAS